MFKNYLTILFLIGFTIPVISQQNNDTIKSVKLFFPKKIGKKKRKLFFDFDARRSYLNGQNVKINGIRIGMTYKGVHRFGLGLYALKNKIEVKGIKVDYNDVGLDSKVRVEFNFTTFFYERVLFKSKKWEVSLPTYYGLGTLNSEYLNNLGNYKSLAKNVFNVLGLGINTNYYVFSWLYPRVMFGYRFAFNAGDKIDKAFTKPFYAVGISINPFGAYRAYKKWDKEN